MKEDSLNIMLSDVLVIKKDYDEKFRKQGTNFNIFEIIKLTTAEVRLHSRFLVELLNPKGSHGQCDLFLKLFVDELGVKGFITENAYTNAEEYIGKVSDTEGGRLDIYLEDKKKNTIIIENKIYAKDQKNQLLRYFNFQEKKHKNSNNELFYLTLFGEEPKELSRNRLISGESFKIISYKNDIRKWLEKCIEEISEKPVLKEGIKQYLELIKVLTGQSNNKDMTKDIANSVLSSAEKVEGALVLCENINEIKTQLQWNFWEVLREDFEKRDYNIFDDEGYLPTEDSVRDYYEGNDCDCYGYWIDIYKKEAFVVSFKIELDVEDGKIYYGFEINKINKDESRQQKSGVAKYAELREEIKVIDSSYESNDYWLGYKIINRPLNFNSFDTEDMYRMGDSLFMQELVKEIVDECSEDISVLKKRLKKCIRNI